MYRDRDYAFGQMMLTLRSAIGLTQAELAKRLGISRQSVVEWEAGNKYPKANHLQELIALAVEQNALPAGREVDEIRSLWKASHQKVLLDEGWLTKLLSAEPDPKTDLVPSPAPAIKTRFHWENALAVDTFYGREWEMRLLSEWVIEKRCRVVTLLGLGGIGKSSLAIQLMHQLADHFDVVIWRSLRDLPTCDVLLIDLLQVLVPQTLGEIGDTFEQRLHVLMEQLRTARILLVLDNVESVLEEGEISGRIRPGYEGFSRFLRQSAETRHQSTILLTSRQKPDDLLPHEGNHAPVRTLRLVALDSQACEQLLAERDVVGSASEQSRLIEAYAGNPLALKIGAQTIVDLFGGEIKPFLDQGGMIFGGVHDLLHEQYIRLSPDERCIVFWLATMREPMSLHQLQSLFAMPLPPAKVLETMNGLHRHSLIERGHASGTFTLQSVVLEYLTEQLIIEASDEIQRGELTLLIQLGLELAHVKDFIRRTQTRLLVTPLLRRLQNMPHFDPEAQICRLMDRLREKPPDMQGYGPANLVALLRLLRGNLRGVDLSRLALRGLYLQGVEMQDARLSEAFLRDCDFTEAFQGINTTAISDNGHYWAASSESGEVRVWEADGHTLCRIWPTSAGVIYRIALSRDGQKLAGGTWDGILKVWDVASGTLLWTVSWPESVSIIYRITFSPDGNSLLVVGNDANLRLLNAFDGMQLQVVPHPQRFMIALWRFDGTMFATGDWEGTIRLWKINPANRSEPAVCVHILAAHTERVTGLTFSPDGTLVATAGLDDIGKFWDVASGELIQTLNEPTRLLRWSPDGNTLARWGYDNIIRLWDVERGNYRAALQGHTATVQVVFFTSNGQRLISSGADGTIRFWDSITGECLRVVHGYANSLADVSWNPDDQQLVSGGHDQLVTIYRLDNSLPPYILHGHNSSIYAVSWNPNGQWLASVGRRNAIRVWDARSRECIQVVRHLDNPNNFFYRIAWSPDGQRLAAGTSEYGVVIWEPGMQQPNWPEESFPIMVGVELAWSPDGTRIAACGQDQQIYIWSAAGILIQQLAGHDTQLTSIDWNPDGTQLLSVGSGEIFVWDMQRGALVSRINDQSAIISGCSWGASEQVVVTGGSDGKLRWWNIQTGECLWVRAAHQGSIQAVRRSWDKTKLATCGDDGAIMIWDLDSGEYLQTVRRDRPYERMDITGIRGLTPAQKATLHALGAIERDLFNDD